MFYVAININNIYVWFIVAEIVHIIPVMRKGMINLRKDLGMQIRNLRKTKGLSQEKLGEMADLSYKYIGELERG